ncbi:MAG: hypothetical protein LC730_01730, partial [Acidobacteria bacterium]|nr:hypothetical protein [Acidobacteriota bacterium]
VHMDPFEAVQAHLDLKSKLSVGIHFGTFRLAFEAYEDPLKDLQKACEERGIANFFAPQFGRTYELSEKAVGSRGQVQNERLPPHL